MCTKRPAVFRSYSLTVAFGVLALLVVGSANPSLRGPSAGPPPERAVEIFPHSDSFLNSKLRTVVGKVAPEGCTFNPPVLSLGPGEHRISMRQLSVDFRDCTTVVEIGVPTAPVKVESGGTGVETPSVLGQTPSARRLASARKGMRLHNLNRAMGTRSGYYEIRFEDRFGIDVNRTQAKLTWSYNGACVTSYNASAWWWWQSNTGWARDGINQQFWTNGGCDSRYSHASGGYDNTAFCGFYVHTLARNVRFRGGYAGGYGGWVEEVSSTYSCQPLHWEADLVG